MLLGFADFTQQASSLATELGVTYKEVRVHRFPDGESKVSLPENLCAEIVICRSLDRPNDKLIELLLTAVTARELGARQLTLVAPYLCYMRQDIAFHSGEAVSQRIIGQFLADLFDRVVTVDPHLHRISRLEQAIPLAHSAAVSAAPLMAAFLNSQDNPLLIGPDSESLQWVKSIAQACQLSYAVASKQRLGDREVVIQLPDLNLDHRNIVLVDDVISSGETMAGTARQCLAAGAARVDALATHALFASGAEQRMHAAGISNIWTTDSITHDSNSLHLAPLLAKALLESQADPD